MEMYGIGERGGEDKDSDYSSDDYSRAADHSLLSGDRSLLANLNTSNINVSQGPHPNLQYLRNLNNLS
jgi:hypothetical protein